MQFIEKEFSDYNNQLVKRLLQFVFAYKTPLFLVLLGLTVITLSDVATPLVLQQVIDRYIVIDQEKFPEFLKLSIEERFQGITFFSLIYLTLITLNYLARFLRRFMNAKITQFVLRDIRIKLIDHCMHQSTNFFTKTPIGYLLSRITSDVETINQFMEDVLPNLIINGSLVIGSIVVLFILNPLLAGYTLLLFPIMIICSLLFKKYLRQTYRNIRRSTSILNTYIVEMVSGIRIVRFFNQNERIKTTFQTKNETVQDAHLKEVKLYAIFNPFVSFFSTLTLAVIIYFGASFYLEDIVSLGVLLTFLSLIQKMFPPILDIIDKLNIVQMTMAGLERIFDLLDNEDKIPNNIAAPVVTQFEKELIFSNVHFRYNKEDRDVLKNINFTLHKGETLALVGYTGSGKSTIANLCNRFWDVSEGSIILDGKDLRDYELHSLRKLIKPIQQTPFFFAGSIRENIDLNNEHSLAEIEWACEAVYAKNFIDQLPEKMDTQLLENGENLSAGEKQLLSFARAICSKPQIIVLDEATANIDTEKEQLIQQALDGLLEHQTAIVIAHRLSTIERADKILVLKEGEVVEYGNHKTLMENRNLYYELYTLQNEKGIIT